jgi:hypothetical protein
MQQTKLSSQLVSNSTCNSHEEEVYCFTIANLTFSKHMADETSGSHVTWTTFPNAYKSCTKSVATSQAADRSYATGQWLRLPRSKYICMQTAAFSSDALQMHWILERNVVSVCTACFKTENSGFCAQIVFTGDLLSFSRKNKMRGSRSEEHVRDHRNTRRGKRAEKNEGVFWGKPGPRRGCSVMDGWMDGCVRGRMDGWMVVWIILKISTYYKSY